MLQLKYGGGLRRSGPREARAWPGPAWAGAEEGKGGRSGVEGNGCHSAVVASLLCINSCALFFPSVGSPAGHPPLSPSSWVPSLTSGHPSAPAT